MNVSLVTIREKKCQGRIEVGQSETSKGKFERDWWIAIGWRMDRFVEVDVIDSIKSIDIGRSFDGKAG